MIPSLSYRKPENNINFWGERKYMSSTILSLHTASYIGSQVTAAISPKSLCLYADVADQVHGAWLFLPLQHLLNQALLAEPTSNMELLIIARNCSSCSLWLQYSPSRAPTQPSTWLSLAPETMVGSCSWNNGWLNGPFLGRSSAPMEPKEPLLLPKDWHLSSARIEHLF